MGDSYDDLLKSLMANQSMPNIPADAQFQQGLLGDTNTGGAEQLLGSMAAKNQANMQAMQSLGQNAVQQGMNAAQGLATTRNAQMDAASQQASQALDAQLKKQLQQGMLIGKLAKTFYKGE